MDKIFSEDGYNTQKLSLGQTLCANVIRRMMLALELLWKPCILLYKHAFAFSFL